jgi:cobalt-zinc-cadmium efflux system outer membrane protein
MGMHLAVLAGGCASTSAPRIAKPAPEPAARAAADSALASTSQAVAAAEDEIASAAILPTAGEEPASVNEPVEAAVRDVAAEPSAPASVLTLADLEALALQHNPTLSQAAAAVEQQWGDYRQAGLYPNPQLGYLNTTANQSDAKQSNGMFLSQEFVTAKKIPLAQAASAQEVKRLQWDQEAQRMRVLNDLRIRYYEALGAQRAVAVHQELEQLSRDNLSTAEQLFRGKSVSKSDVLQAQVLLDSSRIRLAEANHRLEAAWEQLATMAGVPSLPPAPLSEPEDGRLRDLELETQWQTLLAASPQLKSAESELDHGWATLRTAEAQAAPNVTLQTVTDYDRISQSTTVSTLVVLPLPIYNRNQGNIDKAAADVRADQADIARVQLVLRDQLTDSLRRYKSSRMQAETLQQSTLPAVDENLKLTVAAYKAGEVGFREVLQAQETFSQVRVAQIEAETEAQKVAAEIAGLQLTGGLNPAAIGSALQMQPGGSQRQRALLQEVQDRAARQLLPAAQLGR